MHWHRTSHAPEECLSAELGHSGIPMQEYYRSDEIGLETMPYFILKDFFSGIYYISILHQDFSLHFKVL
jgi:hypothetical protein